MNMFLQKMNPNLADLDLPPISAGIFPSIDYDTNEELSFVESGVEVNGKEVRSEDLAGLCCIAFGNTVIVALSLVFSVFFTS